MVDNRENNIWTVYIHIIPKEISDYDYDKYYVGITSKSVEERWLNGLGYQGQLFYDAIMKYGWNNIEHHIIAERITEDEANKMEISLIQKLRCNVFKDKYGYNCTNGGNTTAGYKFSEDIKKEISIRISGENNPFYGKKHTNETKKKMKDHHQNYRRANHPQAKRIHQFTIYGDYINTYDCLRDAADSLGVSENMGMRAKEHKISNGFLWGFDDQVSIINGIPHLNYTYRSLSKNPRHVYMFDYNKEYIKDYISCVDASTDNNIDCSGISRAARKKTKYKKYYWRYEEDIGFTEDGNPYLIA